MLFESTTPVLCSLIVLLSSAILASSRAISHRSKHSHLYIPSGPLSSVHLEELCQLFMLLPRTREYSRSRRIGPGRGDRHHRRCSLGLGRQIWLTRYELLIPQVRDQSSSRLTSWDLLGQLNCLRDRVCSDLNWALDGSIGVFAMSR
jgi:hypothetical protein